jgi:phosphate starvation-inducible PhoH-like protein
LGKRKTGALRKQDSKQNFITNLDESNTFYMNQSKTIDFNQANYNIKNRKSIHISAQSVNQEIYLNHLLDTTKDIVVVSGPAGTGKTYLAMLTAIKLLREGYCDKIILTRPAVTVDDEKHGFLPGDLNEKMEPWVRPLLDILREYYTSKDIKHMFEEQIIEITPLAFCRGRNFHHSFIILDEAQNASPSQIKMLMTRIGTNSKIVITGDIEQTDRKCSLNGLLDLKTKLSNTQIEGLVSCEFVTSDIKRHRIIEHILKLYA